MRTAFLLLALVAAGAVLAAIILRLVPMPPEIWHVDPAQVTPPDSPNFVLLRGAEAPLVEGEVSDVAQRIDNRARSEGATLIAGSVAEGFMTYVARTRLMGFPDAVSIRILPADDGAVRVEIFSRSRFGYSDMGVNAARVDRWLGPLAP